MGLRNKKGLEVTTIVPLVTPTSGTGTAYPFWTAEVTPAFCRVCVVQF